MVGRPWPTLIDAIVDAYVTPEGIAARISNPEVLRTFDIRNSSGSLPAKLKTGQK
jgi:hypothetical protein